MGKRNSEHLLEEVEIDRLLDCRDRFASLRANAELHVQRLLVTSSRSC